MYKITKLTIDGKLSYRLKVETNKETFIIPVIDVRDGVRERNKVDSIIKSVNKSRFLKPTFSLMGYSYQINRFK